ncbi:hypothetical protein ES705_33161 [subsurface metagenome]
MITIPDKINPKPIKDNKFNWSLKMKYPDIMVNAKLIPVATGIVKEKEADDNALNIIKAEANIKRKANSE